MVDCALEDVRAFETVDNLDVLKRVVNELYHRLTVEDILKRLTYSEHCAELCLYLTRKTFRGDEAKSALRRMGNAPSEIFHHDSAADNAIGEVVNALWRHSINEYIIREDFRRAWDEIREGFRGFGAPPYEPGMPPEQGELCASIDTLEDSVRVLYDAMLKPGLVEPIKSTSRTVPHRWWDFPLIPPVAGWPWAAALTNESRGAHPYHSPSHIGPTGMKVLAIVAGLNALRANKPSRKKG